MKVSALPHGRSELKVVQLSDLHLGTLLGERWLVRRIAQVEALAPDLVVVTGTSSTARRRRSSRSSPSCGGWLRRSASGA